MKKTVLFLGGLLFLNVFLLGPLPKASGAEDPRVKPLLQDALRLYSERQYVRALDLFKRVQKIDPTNTTAAEYIANSEQRILEWETQGGDYDATRKPAATWESLLNAKGGTGGIETLTNAKDIIAARRSLVKRMKNRSLNTDNIVKIDDSKRGLSISLFHDQLFLPGLLTLRDEALPILSNVADLIRTSGERQVNIQSLTHSDSRDPYLLFPELPQSRYDPTLPNMKADSSAFAFTDIEASRAFILFTYLAQRSIGQFNQASQ
ncbi:hypothetical protein BVX98_00845 [bacterium F11]|nr:hypothetical protein BVX98_00845 [bacterium F11]